jgi:hypothetical protein
MVGEKLAMPTDARQTGLQDLSCAACATRQDVVRLALRG